MNIIQTLKMTKYLLILDKISDFTNENFILALAFFHSSYTIAELKPPLDSATNPI